MNPTATQTRVDVYSDEINLPEFLHIQQAVAFRAEMANESTSKRILDILFTIFLFIFIFSWLFPIIAIILKITSKGPVFFKQERVSLNSKIIKLYKFRSMVVESRDIDAHGNFCQAIKNDPRITKFGAFLRKTSLDELPQFWNVLKGEISIVGPRPHPVSLSLASQNIIEQYSLRLLIKPGITGWAQINGFRGPTHDISLMQQRIDHDIWYINNWSLFLDTKIIFLTILHIFLENENVY